MESKRFAARNVVLGGGEVLHNGVLEIGEDGTILSIGTLSDIEAKQSGLEIVEGYLCPGFVNAHTHTELAFLDKLFLPGGSMAAFLRQIDTMRLQFSEETVRGSQAVEFETFRKEGIVGYADISNDASTVYFKKNECFRSVSFVEMFGVNAPLAEVAYSVGQDVLAAYRAAGISAYMTPHATYSVSARLWELLQKDLEAAPIFSLHYAETAQEIDFLERRTGAIYNLFHKDWGREVEAYGLGDIERLLKYYGALGKRILLVHCVRMSAAMLDFVKQYCPEATIVPCPESNLFIEGRLADYAMLRHSGVRIAVGTDSLSSSPSLSMLRQLQVINAYYPSIPIEELIAWSTYNGAQGCMFTDLGKLEVGAHPGVNMLVVPSWERGLLEEAHLRVIADRNLLYA